MDEGGFGFDERRVGRDPAAVGNDVGVGGRRKRGCEGAVGSEGTVSGD